MNAPQNASTSVICARERAAPFIGCLSYLIPPSAPPSRSLPKLLLPVVSLPSLPLRLPLPGHSWTSLSSLLLHCTRRRTTPASLLYSSPSRSRRQACEQGKKSEQKSSSEMACVSAVSVTVTACVVPVATQVSGTKSASLSSGKSLALASSSPSKSFASKLNVTNKSRVTMRFVFLSLVFLSFSLFFFSVFVYHSAFLLLSFFFFCLFCELGIDFSSVRLMKCEPYEVLGYDASCSSVHFHHASAAHSSSCLCICDDDSLTRVLVNSNVALGLRLLGNSLSKYNAKQSGMDCCHTHFVLSKEYLPLIVLHFKFDLQSLSYKY